MKICSMCLKEKPFTDFHKRSASPDGLNASCKHCRSTVRKTYESQKEYNKALYWSNPEANSSRVKEWRKSNPEKVKEQKLKWNSENKLKLKLQWAAKTSRRKTRVPSWLTEDQKKQIEEFYWLAADLRAVTGENYQVDHIIPLQGKTVSGLHVPWNLQVLPSDINQRKGNHVPSGFCK